jgi:GNAT superfamily N-acetyltransferase
MLTDEAQTQTRATGPGPTRAIAWLGFVAARATPDHDLIAVPSTVTITDAFVSSTCRRHGIGTALFTAVRKSAAAVGLTALEDGALSLDARAIQFSTALGFGP